MRLNLISLTCALFDGRPLGRLKHFCRISKSSVFSLLLICMGVAPEMAKAADPSPQPTYLNQGWSDDIRQLFYFTPQGSRIIPYTWFMALEDVNGQGQFSAPANLSRYGFLPGNTPHPLNPGALPVGFAVDPVDLPGRGRFLGLTCAACHTADVTVGAKVVRIDGAPAQIDFDRFYIDLALAVRKTLFDGARFTRFAARLGASTPADVLQLRQRFVAFQAAIAGGVAIRHSTVASGFGRVDALTQIVNSISVMDQSEPRNLRLPDAPTSFPQLWLTPELEFVQWNPIAASPIARNGGEVLGVFGEASFTGDITEQYNSSILIPELGAMETWVASLKSPPWDEAIFGTIDRQMAAMGGLLFQQHCVSCHSVPPYRRTDTAANYFQKTFIAIGRTDYRAVGTDPTYVESLTQRLVYTNVRTALLFGGRSIVSAPEFFSGVVGAVLARALEKSALSAAERAALDGFRQRPAPPGSSTPSVPYAPVSFTDIKSGPLPGIWATGPYLHNGSVPTINELLSPVAQRRPVFWTGGQELDIRRLGYMSDDAPGLFRFDTSLPGNHNTGHVYPAAGLNAAERAAIIEFLKTL